MSNLSYLCGNNLGLPEPALADTLEGLEEEVEEDINVPVKFPLDQKGADVLLVTPSADFFAEPRDIPGTDASGVVKAMMDELIDEFKNCDMPNRVHITYPSKTIV